MTFRVLNAPLLLMAGDGVSFVIAGSLGLLMSILVGNASWPGLEDLFEFSIRERLADFFVAGLAWMFWFQAIKNRYQRPSPFWSEVIESSRIIFLLALINLAVIALSRNDYSRSIWFLGWMALLLLIPIIRTLIRVALIRGAGWSRPTWIIGRGENAQEAILALQSEWQMGFSIQGCLSPASLTQERLAALFVGNVNAPEMGDIRQAVFVFALDEGEPGDLSALILELTLAGAKTIHIIPALRGIPLYGADLSYFFSHEVLLLGVRNNLAMRFSKILKRVFDGLVASFLLVPVGFILLVAGCLIWLEDRGPIFYVQKRLGLHQREFLMIKLRSMRGDADCILKEWEVSNTAEWQAYCSNSFKLREDPRLLRVGKFLRRTSIDELPQLFNVLRGEMSLVGPRPILRREMRDYGKNLALYASARPGMTGLWQVSGRSKTSFQQRAALDAWYVRNWSLAYDVILLLRTVSVVLNRKGAY